jgi:hypothetical protein
MMTSSRDNVQQEQLPTYGIDLDYRPDTYWPVSRTREQFLANINGKARREIACEVLDNEGFGGLTAFVARTVLDDEECREWGSVHPWLMGGEYLPQLAEVEIARISLKSTTADQVSVRARQVQGKIEYAVGDEYEMSYRLLFGESVSPLSLEELIAFLDGSVNDEDTYTGGLVISHWNSCVEYVDVEEAADFARVDSAWYPDLDEYYCRVAAGWIEENSSGVDA